MTLFFLLLQVRSLNKQQLDEVIIQCELSRIAASQGERIKRPRDNRTRALSQQIASAFHGAIRKNKYPGSQIDIYVQVCYDQHVLYKFHLFLIFLTSISNNL